MERLQNQSHIDIPSHFPHPSLIMINEFCFSLGSGGNTDFGGMRMNESWELMNEAGGEGPNQGIIGGWGWG
jgi:hypothetical protein